MFAEMVVKIDVKLGLSLLQFMISVIEWLWVLCINLDPISYRNELKCEKGLFTLFFIMDDVFMNLVWALKHSILSISSELLPPVHPTTPHSWWQKQPGCQLPGNIHNHWPTSANYQQKSRIDRWAHAYWSASAATF